MRSDTSFDTKVDETSKNDEVVNILNHFTSYRGEIIICRRPLSNAKMTLRVSINLLELNEGYKLV